MADSIELAKAVAKLVLARLEAEEKNGASATISKHFGEVEISLMISVSLRLVEEGAEAVTAGGTEMANFPTTAFESMAAIGLNDLFFAYGETVLDALSKCLSNMLESEGIENVFPIMRASRALSFVWHGAIMNHYLSENSRLEASADLDSHLSSIKREAFYSGMYFGKSLSEWGETPTGQAVFENFMRSMSARESRSAAAAKRAKWLPIAEPLRKKHPTWSRTALASFIQEQEGGGDLSTIMRAIKPLF